MIEVSAKVLNIGCALAMVRLYWPVYVYVDIQRQPASVVAHETSWAMGFAPNNLGVALSLGDPERVRLQPFYKT